MDNLKKFGKVFLHNLATELKNDNIDNNEKKLEKYNELPDENGFFYRKNENFKKPKSVSSRGCGCGKSKSEIQDNIDEDKKKENMKNKLFN